MNIARTSGNPSVSNDRTPLAGRLARGMGTGLRRTALGLWMGLLAGAGAPVAAAEFQTHLSDDLNIVVVTGEIEPNDDELFLAEVERATLDGQHAMVVLSSDGGALGAGMHMGLVIREAGLPTFVPEGERCASACALAWLAGEPRMTTAASEIGFHQPYDESNGTMVASIEANAVVGHYIATIGMGPEIVSFAVSAPPEGMAWLTPSVALGLGLDVMEIASDGGEAMAMASGRTPPVDEVADPAPGVPLPIMRALTPVEVASVSLTGTVDAGPAGAAVPIVTAYTAEAGVPADAMGGPFEPLLHDAGLDDAGLHGDALHDAGIADEMTGDLADAAHAPVAGDPFMQGTDIANVETGRVRRARLLRRWRPRRAARHLGRLLASHARRPHHARPAILPRLRSRRRRDGGPGRSGRVRRLRRGHPPARAPRAGAGRHAHGLCRCVARRGRHGRRRHGCALSDAPTGCQSDVVEVASDPFASPAAHAYTAHIYYADTDFSGVVYYGRYLEFLERGRSDLLHRAGVRHRDLIAGRGPGIDEPLAWVVRRIALDYAGSARIEDEITVRTALTATRGARLHMAQRVELDGRTIVTAEVEAALVTLAGRPTRIPREWVDALTAG